MSEQHFENWPKPDAYTPHPHHNGHYMEHQTRNPKETNVYLVGGGIASLAAAAHLIHDADIPANQIHILESSSLPGGSMDGAGNSKTGYILRGGRMLNFSYLCTYDLLDKIPSLTDPSKSVKQEIDEFNAIPANKTYAHARLLGKGATGPEKIDVETMGLHARQRGDLLRIAAETEKQLGTSKVNECFEEDFFQTRFWYMWDTMFAFQPWHSAVEFHRYLHRFIQEFSRINSLAGVDRTPYNQYDSIILPIKTYLKTRGVNFQYETKVTTLSFVPGSNITVSEIHFASKAGGHGLIHVESHDLVFVTLGSMTACSSLGSNTAPPASLPSVPDALEDGAWHLWNQLANPEVNPHYAQFGTPSKFYSHPEESNWLSFTVTLKDPDFFNRLEKWTGNKAGTGALVTFTDSAWLMSIVVPHQPHFLNQEEGTQVFWGYGLFPSYPGDIVKKPMSSCCGEEIMTELLGHLKFPLQPILENSLTIPCMMPFITSQFLPRKAGDRPEVIPKGSTNLALLGQFVEIPRDTVFTVEYSVRSAQIAVHDLMRTKHKPKDVYMGEHSPKVLVEALRMLLT